MERAIAADTSEQASTPARRAALRILEGIHHGRPFDTARDRAVQGLDERDRRLAHELSAGVLRQQTVLDDLLAPLVPRGLDSVEAKLLDVLRLGAYQLRAVSRVPTHAAVSTSVDLARETGGSRAAGFVNAVLRRVAAAAPVTASASPDSADALAREHSHPAWLVERWVGRFGLEETASLLAWNNATPSLVLQPARGQLELLRARWESDGVHPEPAPYQAGLVVPSGSPTVLAGFAQGDFIVQDAAQALVARFAAVPQGATVYDACAAPGGKAIALGRIAGRVIAAERRKSRARRLVTNLERAGSGREFAVVADAAAPPCRPVDVVLLDAPCLGTGTFARHPDARWRVRPDALDGIVEEQRRMLESVAPVVRNGGLLVYATCSLEPEENERQVATFLARHSEFHREPGDAVSADLLSDAGDLTILPQRHGMDGAFAARLRRDG
ncbi:MAG: transcription antitermination factor NusB [Gemmatimonadota bacterium]